MKVDFPELEGPQKTIISYFPNFNSAPLSLNISLLSLTVLGSNPAGFIFYFYPKKKVSGVSNFNPKTKANFKSESEKSFLAT